MQRNTQVPVGKHNNRQHASPHHEVATDVKQMPIRPIIIIVLHLWSKFGDSSWVIMLTNKWLIHTPQDRYIDAGDDNTRRPKLVLGKNTYHNPQFETKPAHIYQWDKLMLAHFANVSQFWAGWAENWPGRLKFYEEHTHIRDICFRASAPEIWFPTLSTTWNEFSIWRLS